MLSQMSGSCSPETFAALLKIFESAWVEIEASENVSPEESEAARTELAQLVIAQMDRTDLAETDRLREEVLETFWRARRAR